jgi:hypothetical protein
VTCCWTRASTLITIQDLGEIVFYKQGNTFMIAGDYSVQINFSDPSWAASGNHELKPWFHENQISDRQAVGLTKGQYENGCGPTSGTMALDLSGLQG